MSSTTANSIDVREITPRHRHAVIFDRFDALRVGEALELVNDHDPVPLRAQFEGRSAGRFEWNTLDAGPELWRVRISANKTANTPSQRKADGQLPRPEALPEIR